MSPLRLFASAPGFFSSAFVCELVLESGHGGRISIRVKLPYVLVRENVPVIFGSDRNAGARRGMARPPFRHSIAEFPPLRRNLFLVALALFVVPLVPSADLHAGIFSTRKDFKFIVRLGQIFLYKLFLILHGATPRA